MQTATEITSNLNNLKYYSDKIAELAKKQFELDYAVNSGPGSIRFDCLGTMIMACGLISVYCSNIDANLQSAIKQDKVLHMEEEDAL